MPAQRRSGHKKSAGAVNLFGTAEARSRRGNGTDWPDRVLFLTAFPRQSDACEGDFLLNKEATKIRNRTLALGHLSGAPRAGNSHSGWRGFSIGSLAFVACEVQDIT